MTKMSAKKILAYEPSEKELEKIEKFVNTEFSDNPKYSKEELAKFRCADSIHHLKSKQYVSVNLKLNKQLEDDIESALNDMRLSINTAFTLFVKKVAAKRKLPFRILEYKKRRI